MNKFNSKLNNSKYQAESYTHVLLHEFHQTKYRMHPNFNTALNFTELGID